MKEKPPALSGKHLLTAFETGIQQNQISLTLIFGTKPGLEDGPQLRIPMSREQAALIGKELLKLAGIHAEKPPSAPKN